MLLDEQHRMVRDAVREFVATNVTPHAATWDKDCTFPAEALKGLAALGCYGVAVPEQWGGAGMDYLSLALILEEIAAGDGATSTVVSVNNCPVCSILMAWANDAQKREWLVPLAKGDMLGAFCLTEPHVGSDASALRTTATRDGDHWVINGVKRFNSGVHKATADLVFARTSGRQGEPGGITAFIVPMDAPGVKIEYYHWTFNMPSDHAEVSFTNVRVPADCILNREGEGLVLAQHFVHQNRIRQAAQSAGVARYCIAESVRYASERRSFGKPIAQHQAIQFPLAEMHAECEMVRHYVFRTAWEMDRQPHEAVSDQVAIANYRANRLACNAADLAIQVHGGIGYTRTKAFEHFFRHHRRYRITEGSDEVQIRKIAAYLFGFAGPRKRARKPR